VSTPPEPENGADLDVLIRSSIADPVGIALVEGLLEDAGIPFFRMDASVVPRQKSGNFIGWWNVRVPKAYEADAREIIRSVEEMK
jgi:hypothetical protein